MAGCITMVKYQGLGNDYLVLDPNKNRVQLQGCLLYTSPSPRDTR